MLYNTYNIILNMYRIKTVDVYISDSLISKIGNELNLQMWVSLDDKQKEIIKNDMRDSAMSDYYNVLASITEYPGNKKVGLLNVIAKDEYCGLFTRGTNAIYSYNIDTCKPTLKSQIQTQLTPELHNDIVDEFNKNYKNHKFTHKLIKPKKESIGDIDKQISLLIEKKEQIQKNITPKFKYGVIFNGKHYEGNTKKQLMKDMCISANVLNKLLNDNYKINEHNESNKTNNTIDKPLLIRQFKNNDNVKMIKKTKTISKKKCIDDEIIVKPKPQQIIKYTDEFIDDSTDESIDESTDESVDESTDESTDEINKFKNIGNNKINGRDYKFIPGTITNDMHIEYNEKKYKINEENLKKSGKWMLFVKRKYAKKLWIKCLELSDEIDSHFMKYWDTQKSQDVFPILIYYYPYDDKNYIVNKGKHLITLLSKYFKLSKILNDSYGKFIRYKPNELTRKGIYSGVDKIASIYKLPYL